MKSWTASCPPATSQDQNKLRTSSLRPQVPKLLSFSTIGVPTVCNDHKHGGDDGRGRVHYDEGFDKEQRLDIGNLPKYE